MNDAKIKQIRKDYLSFTFTDNQIKIKYKISELELQQLLLRPSFRKVIKNWIEWKRCKNCNVWKKVESDFIAKQYNKKQDWTISVVYNANCKLCKNIIKRNKKILNPEIIKKENEYKKRRRLKNYDRAREMEKKHEKIYREKHRKEILIRDRIRHRKKYLLIKKQNENKNK